MCVLLIDAYEITNLIFLMFLIEHVNHMWQEIMLYMLVNVFRRQRKLHYCEESDKA
jgi:hypothetical protein